MVSRRGRQRCHTLERNDFAMHPDGAVPTWSVPAGDFAATTSVGMAVGIIAENATAMRSSMAGARASYGLTPSWVRSSAQRAAASPPCGPQLRRRQRLRARRSWLTPALPLKTPSSSPRSTASTNRRFNRACAHQVQATHLLALARGSISAARCSERAVAAISGRQQFPRDRCKSKTPRAGNRPTAMNGATVHSFLPGFHVTTRGISFRSTTVVIERYSPIVPAIALPWFIRGWRSTLPATTMGLRLLGQSTSASGPCLLGRPATLFGYLTLTALTRSVSSRWRSSVITPAVCSTHSFLLVFALPVQRRICLFALATVFRGHAGCMRVARSGVEPGTSCAGMHPRG